MTSSTVAISLTASMQAFSHAAGFKDLVRVRVEDLRIPEDEGGMRVSGWEVFGVWDVARKSVPGPIFGGF
jgi:hypothetical protein